jgi:hypothetical protein
MADARHVRRLPRARHNQRRRHLRAMPLRHPHHPPLRERLAVKHADALRQIAATGPVAYRDVMFAAADCIDRLTDAIARWACERHASDWTAVIVNDDGDLQVLHDEEPYDDDWVVVRRDEFIP